MGYRMQLRRKPPCIALRLLPLIVLALPTQAFSQGNPAFECSVEPEIQSLVDQGRMIEAATLQRDIVQRMVGQSGQLSPSAICQARILAQRFSATGHFSAAEQLLRGLVIPGGTELFGPQSDQVLQARLLLADLLAQSGAFDEAETTYQQVIELLEQVYGSDHQATIIARSNLAIFYTESSRYESARSVFLNIFQLSQRTLNANPELRNIAQINYAQVLSAEGQFADARSLLLELQGLPGLSVQRQIQVAQALAENSYLAGAYDRAAREFSSVVQDLDRMIGDTHPAALGARRRLAQAQVETGNLDAAMANLRQVVDGWVARDQADFPAALLATRDLLRTSLRRQQQPAELEPTIAFLAAGLQGLERRSFDDFAFQTLSLTNAPFELLADSYWAISGDSPQARIEDAFLTLQRGIAGPANQAIAQMAVRRFADEARQGLGELVREREGLVNQWQANDDRFGSSFGEASDDNGALRTRLLEERNIVEAQLDAIDARLEADFPDYFALVQPQPLSVEAAQALLAEDEAILLTAPSEFGTHIIAINRDTIEWHRSDWTVDQVQNAVHRLQWYVGINLVGAVPEDRLAEWAAEHVPGEAYGFDRATAFALYREIVAPVLPILDGKTHLFVAAGDALASMPFSILVTEEPEGADNHPDALRNTAWLADSFALAHIPSIQSLQFLRRASNQETSADFRGSFIGIGDPLLNGVPQQRARRSAIIPNASSLFDWTQMTSGLRMANGDSLRAMNRIPGTAQELRSLARLLNAPEDALFLADRASERVVRSTDLSGARILAFATHGLTGSEFDSLVEPGLVLTPPTTASEEDDGYLGASEVTTLRLDADWVILTACNSASGDGSGLSSLSRAFFYAGARNLLASYWLVDDEVAPVITERTFTLLRDTPGLSRAEAFQQAIREVRMDTRRDDTEASWAHPFFWAPVALIGSGG